MLLNILSLLGSCITVASLFLPNLFVQLITIIVIIAVTLLLRYKKKIGEPWYTISLVVMVSALIFWYKKQNLKSQLEQLYDKKCFIDDIDQLEKDFPDNKNHDAFTDYLNRNTNIKDLRKRCFDREKPFQHEFKEVRISFPDDEPEKGEFFTCKGSPFLDKKIQIRSNDSDEAIEVESGGHTDIDCTIKPDTIQLSKKDGKRLFGKPLYKDNKNYREAFATEVK